MARSRMLARALQKRGIVSSREQDLAAIAAQERELQFTRFDEDVAWHVGSATAGK